MPLVTIGAPRFMTSMWGPSLRTGSPVGPVRVCEAKVVYRGNFPGRGRYSVTALDAARALPGRPPKGYWRMDLTNLIAEGNLDLPRLSKDLDELGHEGRVWAIRSWTKPIQARLFEALRGFRPVTLNDFVPPSVGSLVEVIHDGRNTLPLYTHFQKRFSKPEPADDKLWGYNHQSLSVFTGPGYFVAHTGTEPGEVEIDYREVPPQKPESWPPVVSNSAKLGRFVYAGMVDVMRGLSSHVTVGRAQKKGRFMDAWFVLVREDRQA